MSEIYGQGDFQYTFVENWAKLPEGKRLLECPGVVCDSNDQVFVLTRGPEPIMVVDQDGNYLRAIAEGQISEKRTQGLYIPHDES